MPRYWSWASSEYSVIRVGQEAKIFVDIASYAFSDAVESELVHGAGRNPLGTTDPVYKPADFSFDLHSRWARVWMSDVTDGGAVELGELDFVFVFKRQSRSEINAGLPAIVDRIEFQVLSLADSGESGSAAEQVTPVTCLPTKITRNGVQL